MNWPRFREHLEASRQAAIRRGAVATTHTRRAIGDVATIDQIEAIERSLGRGLPAGLRQTFLEFAESLDAFWFLPDGTRPPIDNLTHGVCAWSLAALPALDQQRRAWLSAMGDSDANVVAGWEESLVVTTVGNGDMLAIREDGTDEPVIYLSCNGGTFNAWRLGDDMTDYLERASQLAFVGPEWWQLEPFLVSRDNGLVTSSSNARLWQEWLGVAAWH